jgi:hypothetical protein
MPVSEYKMTMDDDLTITLDLFGYLVRVQCVYTIGEVGGVCCTLDLSPSY